MSLLRKIIGGKILLIKPKFDLITNALDKGISIYIKNIKGEYEAVNKERFKQLYKPTRLKYITNDGREVDYKDCQFYVDYSDLKKLNDINRSFGAHNITGGILPPASVSGPEPIFAKHILDTKDYAKLCWKDYNTKKYLGKYVRHEQKHGANGGAGYFYNHVIFSNNQIENRDDSRIYPVPCETEVDKTNFKRLFNRLTRKSRKSRKYKKSRKSK